MILQPKSDARVGALISQYFFVGKIHERTLWTTLLLMQTSVALGLQCMDVGSAAIFFMSALPLFIVVLINPLFASGSGHVALISYALGQIFPLLTSSLLAIPTLEVFVPLVSGRPPTFHDGEVTL